MWILEGALWFVLLAAGAYGIGRGARRRDGRFGVAVFLAALLVRLLVPRVPLNWYMGIANLPLSQEIFSRPTTTLPLPGRLALFHLGGFDALVGFDIVCGALCALLSWDAARTAGYSERFSRILSILVALVPVHVRVAASDGSHGIALMLWLAAASAFARGVKGHRLALLPLAAATVLGCPIRVEAGLMFAAVPVFVAAAPGAFDRVRRATAALAVLGIALLVGLLISWSFLGPSWTHRLGRDFQPLSIFLFVVLRTALLIDPFPPYFLPVPVVLAGWLAIGTAIRRRQRSRLAAMLGPIALFSVPFAWQSPIFNDLPSAGYHVIYLVLVLVPCTIGFEIALDAVSAWRRRMPKRTGALVGVVGVAFAISLVPAYRITYAYQEEHRFLRDQLPRARARILAIFDPETGGPGDFDSSLALPYPTLLADRPDLTWTVLTKRDLADDARWSRLDFDYYYPGSMAAIPPDAIDDWIVSRIARKLVPSRMQSFFDPEESRLQKQHLRSIAELDRRVRQHFALEPFARATVPARTFGSGTFPDGRTTLVLFKRRPADPPSSAR